MLILHGDKANYGIGGYSSHLCWLIVMVMVLERWDLRTNDDVAMLKLRFRCLAENLWNSAPVILPDS